MSSCPFSVSVVIPTFNRRESLLRTLDSLSRQSYPAECFEAVVVDDGSTDDTGPVLGSSYPFRLVYRRQQNQGEVTARNVGAELGTGSLLVFLDDDIETGPGYLEALVRAHTAHPRSVVLGSIMPVVRQGQTPFERIYSRVTAVSRASDGAIEPVPFVACTSGVLSISREGFFEVGQMQALGEGGRNIWGGIDLAYRAFQHGYSFWRSLDAVALHHDAGIADLRTYCARMYRASEAAGSLFVKYPQLIGQIPIFRDKSPVAWRADPAGLIGRKLLRNLVSLHSSQWAIGALIALFERVRPQAGLLEHLYHWVVSAHIRAGYRSALRFYLQHRGVA